jgi:acetyltransferase-like isoleucine patch superfamily enzyme
MNLGFTQDNAQSSSVPNKDLEVAMGIDVIEKLDFDYSPKITIGNDVLIAHNVNIIDTQAHELDSSERSQRYLGVHHCQTYVVYN